MAYICSMQIHHLIINLLGFHVFHSTCFWGLSVILLISFVDILRLFLIGFICGAGGKWVTMQDAKTTGFSFVAIVHMEPKDGLWHLKECVRGLQAPQLKLYTCIPCCEAEGEVGYSLFSLLDPNPCCSSLIYLLI